MADNNLTPKEEFLLNPVEEHNIENAPLATFETNLKHGLKVTVPFAPKQDLHGYDHPWPAGGSVNLIPDGTDTNNGYVLNAYIDVDGAVHSNPGTDISEYFKVLSEENYTWSCTNLTMNATAICFYDENKTFISGIASGSSTASPTFPKTITTPTDSVYCRISVASGSGHKNQLEKGSTATSYVPHSNICPIEGWNGANIKSSGKNLLTISNGTEILDTWKDRSGSSQAYVISGLDPNQYFTLSVNVTNGLGTEGGHRLYLEGIGGTPFIDTGIAGRASITRKPNADGVIKVTQNGYALTHPVEYAEALTQMQLEVGILMTDFEDPRHTTIPITFSQASDHAFLPIQEGYGDPSPDNIRPIRPGLSFVRDDNSTLDVYGGTLTVNENGTGIIDVSYSGVILDGTNIVDTGFDSVRTDATNIKDVTVSQMNLFICDKFTPHVNSEFYNMVNQFVVNGYNWIYVRSPDLFSDVQSANDYFRGNPTTVVGPVAAPTTYALSTTETNRALEALGLTQHIGTQYGGTLTLNEDGSADVVADSAKLIIDGVNTPVMVVSANYIGQTTTRGYRAKFAVNPLTPRKAIAETAIHKSLVSDYGYQTFSIQLDGETSIRLLNSLTGITAEDTPASATSKMNAYLSEHPFKFIYKLSTPQTYHIPNVGQLKAFLGQNNVWSDLGNVNVKYLTQHSETGVEWRRDRALELHRRVMIANGPKLHTAVGSSETGGIANFKAYIKSPVKSVTVPFYPKQDLHGYDYPWPAGGGKNKFNVESTFANPSDTTSANTTKRIFQANTFCAGLAYSNYFVTTQILSYSTDGGVIKVQNKNVYGVAFATELTAGEYFLSATVTNGGRIDVVFYGADGSWLSADRQKENSSFTVPSDAAKTVFIFYSPTPDTEATFSSVQIEEGSTATAYAPYENICPIEGKAKCSISATNKNILGGSALGAALKTLPDSSYGSDDNGRYVKQGGYANKVNEYVFEGIKENTQYTFLFKMMSESADLWRYMVVYTDGTEDYAFEPTTLGVYRYVSKANKTLYSIYNRKITTNSCYVYYDESGIFEGVIDVDEYVPYSGTTVPIVFNQSGDHEFLPRQEGSGGPSPENVRPIHPGLTFTRDDDSVLSVYGGTLTVNADGTGSLVSELTTPRNVGAPYIYGNNLCFAFDRTDMVNNSDPTGAKFVTEFMKYTGGANTGLNVNLYAGFCFIGSNGLNKLGLPEMAIGGELNPYWSNWYSSFVDPPKVVASLAIPITYTLSVTETNRALEALGLTQHAGTLYGGTVTINPDGSADVVNKYACRMLGSLSYVQEPNASNNEPWNHRWLARHWISGTNATWEFDGEFICSELRKGNAYTNYTYETSTGYIYDNTISTVAEFREKYANTQIAYPIKPQFYTTYHFDNVGQLKVWLGENNFWCDISDDITVKYWNRG